MASRTVRVGVIGAGFIGRAIAARLLVGLQGAGGDAAGMTLAFVHARDPSKLATIEHLPPECIARSLAELGRFRPDLIVECAHPDISHRHGADFLAFADYLPLSVNALARPDTERALVAAGRQSGHRLFIPHGALIGLDNLVEMRDVWSEVMITFRKHPDQIDFAESGLRRETITGETVLYDGPTRGIAERFPRNVNTMTTCALATVGLDRCRSVLIADPALTVAIAEVRAVAKDGSLHESRKAQRMVGVSGTEMVAAQWSSVRRAAGITGPGINFV